MLFQDIIDYLRPKMKFACEFIGALIWFVFLIFGLNIFAAVAAAI